MTTYPRVELITLLLPPASSEFWSPKVWPAFKFTARFTRFKGLFCWHLGEPLSTGMCLIIPVLTSQLSLFLCMGKPLEAQTPHQLLANVVFKRERKSYSSF